MMTVEQKRRILQRISEAQSQIEELQRVRYELALNGTASATLASGGGSKSYTRLDLDKISAQISQLAKSLIRWRRMLAGEPELFIRHIYRVYA